jgi:hypothetical protein
MVCGDGGEFLVPDDPCMVGTVDDVMHAVGGQGGQVVLRLEP